MIATAQAEVTAERPDALSGPVSQPRAVAFVESPSALAAFQLVLRLRRSRLQRQDGAGRWVVHVPVTGPDAVRRLLEDVQLWLHGEQIAETRVRVGGDVYRVGREYAPTDLRQKGIDGL